MKNESNRFNEIDNFPKQGLKRSVTTLIGGSLGYAEVVALKVRYFIIY